MCLFKPKPKPPDPPAPIPFDPAANGYEPVFVEDFLNPIDWTKWDHTLAYGQDQKGVTKWTRECVVQIAQGVNLIAKKGDGVNYCGQLTTWKFMETCYGYIRFKAKVPPGGFLYFTALWGHNKGGWQPEIDIVEFAGKDSKEVMFTHHTAQPDGSNLADGGIWKSPIDLSEDFHTYSVLWTPDKLTWFIDEIERWSDISNVPNTPIYWIMGIQSGGIEGGYNHLFTEEESGKSMIIEKFEIWQL